MAVPSAAFVSPAEAGTKPVLLYVCGADQRNIPMERSPFTIGRKTDKDLVIPDSRVSRDHAAIVAEDGGFVLVDQGSRHGTFVNGVRRERHKLERNDRIEFGARDAAYVIFHPDKPHPSTSAAQFLSQVSMMPLSPATSDLEKLTLFLEAARKLNTTGVLEDVLVTLVDSTLRLTHAERGFVFLRGPDGKMRMAAGRNSRGEPLRDETTISRSILEDAANAATEFIVTDTSASTELAGRNSIIAYDLRTVICVPLRSRSVQDRPDARSAPDARDVRGVLYLDSRFASRDISAVSHDILRAIATEAAALVENAQLVQAEEANRRYQQELSIAASIQQRLMTVSIPDVPYASVRATNLACKDVGGDFFDVVPTRSGLAVVMADVSGKGISAALLANILQGMIYSQLVADVALPEVVASANRFLCQRVMGQKYATLVLIRVEPGGDSEYVCCGHIPPVLVRNGQVQRAEKGNLPVGLIPDAHYESGRLQLLPGDRLVLVTDGVTEAENSAGDLFGDDRLAAAVLTAESPFDGIFSSVRAFCGDTPLGDDCTILELAYKGQ